MPSISVPSLVDALTDSLKERILTGDIPGGATLTESEVAREYDVARPTAKGAIERLVSVGLLQRSLYKSARVRTIGPDDIRDVYFARSYLESMAARTLAEHQQVPAEAEMAIEALRSADDTGLVGQLVAPDIAFHRSLVDAVGSPRVARMHREIMGEMQLSMAQVQAYHLLDRDLIVADHRRIVDQIKQGDVEAANDAVLQHLDRACGALLGHFLGSLHSG